mmetsp:Transcript_28934/g.59333  ORF Transcript_28934/g.59333 Transcript_28934/m.59333 type:complete len:84 (+) Transcript_28934:109-360(+)
MTIVENDGMDLWSKGCCGCKVNHIKIIFCDDFLALRGSREIVKYQGYEAMHDVMNPLEHYSFCSFCVHVVFVNEKTKYLSLSK